MFERRLNRLGWDFALVSSSADTGLFMLCDIFFCYLTLYFLIPKTLLQKKFWEFMLLFILAAAAYGFIRNVYFDYYIIPRRSATGLTFLPNRNLISIINLSHPYFLTTGFASFILLAKHWYFSQQENIDLQRKMKAGKENVMGRSNPPHFLQDLLKRIKENNILFERKKNSEIMEKLTVLTSYSIYEASRKTILLKSEIQLIIDYLSLEKLLNENVQVRFDNNKEDLSNEVIAPALLIPFIENVFTNILRHPLNAPWININLTVINSQLKFYIANAKPDGNLFLSEYKSQIYNEALNRLALYYPKAYETELAIDTNHFSFNLSIDLGKVVLYPNS